MVISRVSFLYIVFSAFTFTGCSNGFKAKHLSWSASSHQDFERVEDMLFRPHRKQGSLRTQGAGIYDTTLERHVDPWVNGVLPVAFESDAPDIRAMFFNACADWATAGVSCVDRTTEAIYLTVRSNQPGCFSSVGMSYGANANFHYPDCFTPGLFRHEIGHAFGRIHEHGRWDRDQYVLIQSENINSAIGVPDFARMLPSLRFEDIPYDYASVMHYARTAGSINGRDTIVPLNLNFLNIIGSQTISSLDIETMRRIAAAGVPAPGPTTDPATGPVLPSRPQVTLSQNRGTSTSDGQTADAWQLFWSASGESIQGCSMDITRPDGSYVAPFSPTPATGGTIIGAQTLVGTFTYRYRCWNAAGSSEDAILIHTVVRRADFPSCPIDHGTGYLKDNICWAFSCEPGYIRGTFSCDLPVISLSQDKPTTLSDGTPGNGESWTLSWSVSRTNLTSCTLEITRPDGSYVAPFPVDFAGGRGSRTLNTTQIGNFNFKLVCWEIPGLSSFYSTLLHEVRLR